MNYDKDSKGNPVLPIFKMAAGETTGGGVEVPVFREERAHLESGTTERQRE